MKFWNDMKRASGNLANRILMVGNPESGLPEQIDVKGLVDSVKSLSLSQSVGSATDKSPSEKAVATTLKSYPKLDAKGYVPISYIPLATEDQDGLIDKNKLKQLNEIIEGMKTTTERFDTTLSLMFSNEQAVSTNYELLTLGVSDAKQPLECIVSGKNYENASTFAGKDATKVVLDISTSEVNDRVNVYVNNTKNITMQNIPKEVEGVILSSKNGNLSSISLNKCQARAINATGVANLKLIYFQECMNIEKMKLTTNKHLEYAVGAGSKALKQVALHGGNNLKLVSVSNCTSLANLYIENPCSNLETIDMTNTPITKEYLMGSIEPKWNSRVGKTAGKFKLPQDLYDALSDADKKKFADKNINVHY